MRIAFCWMGVSGYMAASWKALSSMKDHKLRVFAKPASNQYLFNSNLLMNHIDWVPFNPVEVEANKLYEDLEKFKPDVVIFSGWLHKAYRCLPWQKISSNPKFVLAMDNHWIGSMKQYFASLLLSPLIRKVDGVLVPGKRGKDFAIRLGVPISKISIGLYGYDGRQFSRQPSFESKPINKEFLFVGRYAASKGIETLIEAYEIYRNKVDTPWSLVCCGTGPLKHILEGRDGVEDRGFVQPSALGTLLSSAGCFVLPSTAEPWGVALAEACGSGLPVICSQAVGAADDLIEDLTSGLVVPPGDPDALKNALLTIHNRECDIEAMVSSAYEKAQKFESKNWAKNIIAFAERIVSAKDMS